MNTKTGCRACESNPAFELVIPSTASGYIERDFFGQKSVELYFGPGAGNS